MQAEASNTRRTSRPGAGRHHGAATVSRNVSGLKPAEVGCSRAARVSPAGGLSRTAVGSGRPAIHVGGGSNPSLAGPVTAAAAGRMALEFPPQADRGCARAVRPRPAQPDRRLLDPRRAGARARPGAWPAAPGLDFLVLAQEPDEPGVAAHLAALAAAPTSPSCGSRPPGWRAAATPRSTPPAARSCSSPTTTSSTRRAPIAGIRRFFAENPGLDLFVGRSLDPDGRPRKRPLPRRAG